MENSTEKKESKKNRILILLLLLIALLATCVAVWALFFREPEVILAPDYVPQETEKYAETLPEEEKMDAPAGGGAVSLSYSKDVQIDLKEKKAALFFANPSKSHQDAMIQIVVQGEVLAQSGVLPPGHRVTTLDLISGAEAMLMPGGYQGTFLVLYYHSETGEKAVVNTEIPIQITVKS